MLVETKKNIISVMEAVVVVRRADRTGKLAPIEPCVRYDQEGKVILCPDLDLKAVRNFCMYKEGAITDPEGAITDSEGVECPRQKGRILLLTISEYDRATTQKKTSVRDVISVGSTRLTESIRSPYFVK